MPDARRPLVWIGRSKKDFSRFPEEVQEDFTRSLELARKGARDIPRAKPLSHGLLKGLGVIELIEDFDGDTYRAVYTKDRCGARRPSCVQKEVEERHRDPAARDRADPESVPDRGSALFQAT